MEGARDRPSVPASADRRPRVPRRRGAVLLRLARAPARRCVVGLGRAPREVRDDGARRSSTSRAGTTRRTGRRARSRTSRACSRRARTEKDARDAPGARPVDPRRRGHGPLRATARSARSAPIDYAAMILRFMDRYVRGIDNGLDREPRVRAFVMGENVWRSGDTMPLPGTRSVSFYLAAGGTLGPREPAAAGAASSSFVSDPAASGRGPVRVQRPARTTTARSPTRKDVLVFETEPLAEPLRVVGPIGRRDVSLGRRARRRPLGAPRGRRAGRHGLEPVEPGHGRAARERPGRRPHAEARSSPARPVLLRLPNLRTGNLFGKGHRVRIVVCGSFMPHFSRNLQTGESETVSAKSRPATLRIHHDAAHPSRIVLPVVPDAKGEAMRRIVPAALAILLSASALRGVQIQEVRIPMKDGVTLAADLWRPDEGTGPYPVLLEYLPYRKTRVPRGSFHLYDYFVRHGYVVARVDIRGTGNSEGTADSLRVQRDRAARRRGGHRVAGGPALLQRQRRHVRHLVGRLQLDPHGDAQPAGAEGDHRRRRDRRPVPRRRALHGRDHARGHVGDEPGPLQRDARRAGLRPRREILPGALRPAALDAAPTRRSSATARSGTARP